MSVVPPRTDAVIAGVNKAGTTSLFVTLSTHPSEAAAEAGWKALAAKHAPVLESRTPLVSPIARDDGATVAYRLATGPFASAREAAAFCDQLLARHAYCVISG